MQTQCLSCGSGDQRCILQSSVGKARVVAGRVFMEDPGGVHGENVLASVARGGGGWLPRFSSHAECKCKMAMQPPAQRHGDSSGNCQMEDDSLLSARMVYLIFSPSFFRGLVAGFHVPRWKQPKKKTHMVLRDFLDSEDTASLVIWAAFVPEWLYESCLKPNSTPCKLS